MEADDNCVTMMTIHSAKGLEFPVVYVVGMEEGIFPGGSAQYDMEELEEERRLCYVAMTRAKEKLTLTNCRQRMLYGRTSANRASRFLEEIPEDNMRWESKPQPRFVQDDTFGGDRWDSEREEITRTIGARTPARPARPAGGGYTTGGYTTNTPWSGGGSVYTYKAKPQTQEKPLASVRRGATTPTTHLMQINQGDMVEHTAFGKGLVMSMRPMGGDALIEVAFDKVGTKKLMLKSAGAHMKKL